MQSYSGLIGLIDRTGPYPTIERLEIYTNSMLQCEHNDYLSSNSQQHVAIWIYEEVPWI